MFKTVSAVGLALACASTPALAGGLAPVVEAQALVVEDAPVARRPSAGALVPLLLIGALVAVAASSDDGDDDTRGGTKGDGGGPDTPPDDTTPDDPCN